tara:strand:+ start:113 stop:373 length:261 start_codon:yes stop_codon:yes gene_type:complete
MCYITDVTNQYISKLEKEQKRYEKAFEYVSEFKALEVSEEMDEQTLNIIKACAKVDDGSMTFEQLGRMVMAIRNGIIDDMIEKMIR